MKLASYTSCESYVEAKKYMQNVVQTCHSFFNHFSFTFHLGTNLKSIISNKDLIEYHTIFNNVISIRARIILILYIILWYLKRSFVLTTYIFLQWILQNILGLQKNAETFLILYGELKYLGINFKKIHLLEFVYILKTFTHNLKICINLTQNEYVRK